jgi:multiple sugar transport system permease protein
MESTINSQEIYKLSFKEKLRNFYHDQKGWIYILPILALMAVFTFYPLVRTTIYAFQNGYSSLDKSYNGWGIENFTYVLQYKKFQYCLANTVIFSVFAVPISTLLALLISVGLNSIKWVQRAYQTIFFLPYLTNALAVGAVFATMFQIVGTGSVTFSYGLINQIFHTEIDWLAVSQDNIWWNRIVVIVYEIWAGLPFKILILFGALQNVNKQYYDAAKIDGTSRHRTLWKITVPLISPMLSYLLITGFIGGFKAYTAVVGIFGAQTVERSYINTMVGYIYDNIGLGSTGVAAAGALILFVLILFFTLINLYVSKKRVHY